MCLQHCIDLSPFLIFICPKEEKNVGNRLKGRSHGFSLLCLFPFESIVQTESLLPTQFVVVGIKACPCLGGESWHLAAWSNEKTFITEEAGVLLPSEHSERDRDVNLDSFLASVPFNVPMCTRGFLTRWRYN